MDRSEWSYLVSKVQKIESLVESACVAGGMVLMLNIIAHWYAIESVVIYGASAASGYAAYWEGRRRTAKYWEIRSGDEN